MSTQAERENWKRQCAEAFPDGPTHYEAVVAMKALLQDVATLSQSLTEAVAAKHSAMNERDAAERVADRQRSRAKDAESELQRVKQERDAFQRALLDAWSEWSETTITELPTESLTSVLRAVNERAEKAEADAAEMRSAIERACTDPGGLKGPDEWSHDIDMLRAARNGDAGRDLLAEVARLREENAALKTTLEAEQVGRHTEVLHLVEQLATVHQSNGLTNEWMTRIKAVFADPEGRAAAEYVTALESEHEAVTAHRVNGASGEILDAAHAAVGALRTVKP